MDYNLWHKMNTKNCIYGGYEFSLTCCACHEQYDVYDGTEYIAYVRKRFGRLEVHPVLDNDIQWSDIMYSEYEDSELYGTIDDKENTLNNIAKEIKKYYGKQ